MKELEAPEGYQLPKEPFQLTVVKDYKVQTFTLENKKIEVSVEKRDTETREFVAGAVLELWNEQGEKAASWTTGEKPEKILGLTPGKYVLKEVKTPEGYLLLPVHQEIVVSNASGIQTFVVLNQKLEVDVVKKDKESGKPLTGAVMRLVRNSDQAVIREWVSGQVPEVFQGLKPGSYTLEERKAPDGSVYFEGVTGRDGTVRFKKPGSGSYVFQETKAPDGYYLNRNVYQFVVGIDGKTAGEDTVPDYKKTTVIISKEDVTTSEELPGAEIVITDKDGNEVFKGTSDENGKVYFEVPAPGEYHFRETVAPKGYELNETVFSFTVFEDGSILGDCTITDRKHYGRITASYETERKGDGDVTVGELLHAPKTRDTSGLAGLFAVWLASVAGLAGMVFWRRKRKKGDDGTPPGGGGASGSVGQRWKEKGKKRVRGKDCGKHGNQAGERRNSGLGEFGWYAGERGRSKLRKAGRSAREGGGEKPCVPGEFAKKAIW